MKHRVHLLASTAASFAAVVGAAQAGAQTTTTVSGNGGTGTFVGSGTTKVGSTGTQTVYSGFDTVGGNGAGGGGGLGGVFFVNQGATLQLTNVSFANNAATGGQGGGVRIDSIAPFAFSVASTSVDASAYVLSNPVVGATFTNGQVVVNSLTLSQPNPLIGTGSGVGLVLSSANQYPAYSSSIASTTANANGTQTLTLATPIALSVNQGLTSATLDKKGNWSFSSTNGTDIQSGMAVVKTSANETLPDGLLVDQVTRDGNNQITAITLKFADGTPYQLGRDASVYVVNGLTYDISRVATSVNGSSTSNQLVSTGALSGFVKGQTVTGNGVPANTTVTDVGTHVDADTGNTVTTVTLSNAVDLTQATTIKASLNPVVSNGANPVLALASVNGLAVGQTISGSGIPAGTKITAINGNTVTLSQTLGAAATNAIKNNSLLLTVDPVVATGSGSVTLTSLNGYRVGDALAGSSIPANARITGINQLTNTVTYVIDPTLATANLGGAMNGRTASGTPGTQGSNGVTGTSYSATFDNGEGAPGSNASSGGIGSGAAGGNGGNGGSGSNGSSTNKTLITTLALDTAALAADFLSTADDAAGLFTLPSVPGDIAHAVVDGGHVAFDAVQLTAWQIAEKQGLVALGGQGGQGGNGGAGGEFFGGGSGGIGGNGGNGAESYSIGGAAGNGGNGGAGGFGAGGGNGGAAGQAGANGANSGANANGAGGAAGFGGGTGSSGGQGGQGGSGFGGAIFVRGGGTLTISGNSVFQNNAAFAGSSNNGGSAGSSAGGDLFMMRGSSVTLTPGAGNVIAFYDSIADDSSASIGGAIAAGQGAGLTIGGGGTVQMFGTDTYTGATTITGATLEAQDGVGINPYSQIAFAGAGTIGSALSSATAGVLLSGGTITRSIGTAPNNVYFAGSGGFAGTAANLVLNFGSPTTNAGPGLTWGAGGFVPVGKTLVFGSDAVDATGTVTLQNAINLGGNTGDIAVYHNAGATAAYDAAITGAITNGTLQVGDAGYAGTLLLSGQNALSGITLNAGTVSTVNGSQIGRLMNATTGGAVQVNGGTLVLGGAEKLTTVTVAAGGSLLAAGAVNAGAITNAGISGFASTLNAASIDNSGVLGLMGQTTVTGAIVNEAGGTLRQLAAVGAASVANAGTWSLAGDLTSGSVANTGEIDVVGTVANGAETAATRTIHTGALTGTAGSIVNLGGIAGTVANTLVVDQSGSSTDAGAFKGAGALTKAGAGTLTLTGASSFTGGLTVAAGTLDTTGGGTFADTLAIGIASGATLIVGTADTVGAVTNAGTLTANANYTTASLANAGTARSNAALSVTGNVANTGSLVLAGAQARVGGGVTNGGILTSGGALAVAGQFANRAGGTATFVGAGITQLGSLVNAGTITTAGLLSVAGGYEQDAGSLTATGLVTTGSLSGAGGSIVLAHGSQLAVNQTGDASYAGTIGGSGAFTKGGAATLTLTGGRGSIAPATLAVLAGGVTVQQAGALGGSLVAGVAAPATLTLNGDQSIATLTNEGSVLLGADLTTGGPLLNDGTLTVVGAAGTTRTLHTPGFAGGSAAVVQLGGIDGTAANTLVIDQSGASSFAGTFIGAGGLTKAGAGTLMLSGGSSFAGDLAASGGTLILTGTNGYTGRTRIANGATLMLAGTGAIATSSGVTDDGLFSIAATNAGAAIASLAGAGAVDLGGQPLTLTDAADTFTGAIGGSGSLTIAGGTQALAGVNGYTGATIIAAPATLALTGIGAIAASAGVLDNGVLDISGSSNGASIATLAGTGTLLLGGQVLTLTGAADSFAGTVTGTGGVAVTGGTQTLTGANGYTGQTVIAPGGTLALAGGGSIAASSRLVDNGRFDLSATTGGASIASLAGTGTVGLGARQLTLTNAGDVFAGSIDGSGGLTLAGGTEYLAGGNSYAGITIVDQGATLGLTGNGSIAQSAGVLDNGTFAIDQTAAGARIASLAGTGIVTLGTQTLTLTGAGNAFAGAINGTGGLTVAGGVEALTGANTYTGGTDVAANAGLLVTGAGTIAASSLVTVDGTLDLSQATTPAIRSLAGGGTVVVGAPGLLLTAAATGFGGTIAGNGGVEVAGGTQTLGGANVYTGRTLVDAGAGLALAGGGTIAGSAGVTVDGTLDLTAAAGNVAINQLDGGATGTIALGNGQLAVAQASGTYAGTIAGPGSLAVLGGTQTLTGASSYAGGTTVRGATLAIGSDAALGAASGPLTLDTATLRFLAPTTSTRATALAGGVVLDTAGNAVAFNGTIGGAGTLVAAGGGTLALGGSNVHAGGTQVIGGTTLQIAADAALGAATGALVIDNGTLRAGADLSVAHPILVGRQARFDGNGHTLGVTGTVYGQDGAGFDPIATGGFRLTGILDVTPAGGFTLASGSLLRGTGTFNRAMLVNGTLAPGNSPGTMTFAAPVTIAPGGTLSIDIDGTGTGTGGGNYSRLVLTGSGSVFTAGGIFRPVLRGITGSATNGYTPALGQSFVVVQTPNAVVGSFAGVAQPGAGLAAGTRFDLVYGNNVTAFVTPADYANLAPLGIAQTQNQVAAGTALNALRGDAGVRTAPAVNQLLGTLFGFDANAVARFEDRLAGGIYGDALRLAEARAQSFGRIVDGQADTVMRTGSQLWVTGYGQDFDLGTSRSHHTYGVAGGIGLAIHDDAVVGIAAGHDSGSLSQLASGNTADVDLTHVTLYAAYTGSHAFARLRAGATRTQVTSIRSIPDLNSTARGETSGWGFAGSAEAGYATGLGDWSLTPSLGVRSTRIDLNAFTETGAGPVSLVVAEQRFNGVQGIAKLSVARDFDLSPGATLRPQLDFGYLRELGDRIGRTTQAFAVAPGASVGVATVANGRDGFRFGAGVTVETAGHVSIFARGDLDTQANVNTRSGSIGLAYRW